MEKVQKGNVVTVHYHGKLTDGTTFDSSAGREPLQFEAGSGQVIKGFDDAVLEMIAGEKKTVLIPVVDAYGERDEEMVMEFPISDFPADMTPEIGLELQMGDDHGNIFPVVVVEIGDDVVFLDANHPLAGKELIFDLELVSFT